MLRRLHIKNFKLLRDVELEFSPDVPTVLIGANSSGKSTVIEVLDFLSRCATDGFESAVVAHGGMASLRTFGVTEPVEIESTWLVGGFDLVWRLRFDTLRQGRVRVDAEWIRFKDRDAVTTDGDGVRVVHGDEATTAPQHLDDPRRLAFEVIVDPARYFALFTLKLLVSHIRVIGALATAPSWARSSAERASARDTMVLSTQEFVGREGIGLATALYNLHTNHPDAWERLHRALHGEFPFVKRVAFPADPGGGRISFAIEDERFRGLLLASEMSDGFIGFLCLLSLLVHPDQIAALAFDEPDAHLHPSAVRRFLALAHDTRHARTLIIVTHSTVVLDELDDPAASIRIVEATKDGARIRKLDPDALVAWRKEYSMSELRQSGLLDPSNGSYGSDE